MPSCGWTMNANDLRDRFQRFGIEVTLLVAFFLLGWYLDSTIAPFRLYRFIGIGVYTNSHAVWVGALLIVFFMMVFYGTSYVVTPLSIFRNLNRQMVLLTQNIALQKVSRELAKKAESSPLQTASVTSSQTDLISPGNGNVLRLTGAEQSEPADPYHVDQLLRRFASNTAALAKRMERRTNTHLILGMVTGVAGLAVWYVAFTRIPADLHGWAFLGFAIPRFTVLVFIEVLAGYFLQQYRIGVEDFKYFFSLSRKSHSERVAWAMLHEAKDNEILRSFALSVAMVVPDQKPKSAESSMKAIDQVNPGIEAIKVIESTIENALKTLKDVKK